MARRPAATRAKAATPSTTAATVPAAAAATAAASREAEAARATIAQLRDAACEVARAQLKDGAAPIRIMARMVAELESRCRELELPPHIVAEEIVNRTIGDVDVRRISARDDGPEYVTLADEMALAFPGQQLDGYTATGERYLRLHRRMEDFERDLLARHIDLRIYDLAGTGNIVLREMMADYTRQHWGLDIPAAQLHLSLGSLDGLGKYFQAFAALQRQHGIEQNAVLFPAPGFNVPEWQARSLGLRIHRIHTRPEDHFKVTPEQLHAAIDEAPDLHAFYLTVSNNPTAFAYTPDELRALFATVAASGRDITILGDLAYIGTGDPEADRARMQAFNTPETLARCVLFFSFSKTHTLTGDRFGWVTFGDVSRATAFVPGWSNTTASLPAEWQLRYMAQAELFAQHPEIEQRIRALYRHRRARLVRQLEHLNQCHHLFAQINLDDGGTVYNWSQLVPGEDVFSLFSKTGIAGVPGSAFGYSDDFVRLSVGCIPVPAIEP